MLRNLNTKNRPQIETKHLVSYKNINRMKKNNLKIQYDVYCILSIFCFVFIITFDRTQIRRRTTHRCFHPCLKTGPKMI